MTTVDKLVELIRRTSSSLPDDVLKAIKAAKRRERKGSSAEVVLDTILENCKLAKRHGLPLCQDTGTLTFFIDERLRRKRRRHQTFVDIVRILPLGATEDARRVPLHERDAQRDLPPGIRRRMRRLHDDERDQ